MKTMIFRTLTRLAGLCFCFTLISICLTSCGSEPAERISIATLIQAEQQNEVAAYNKYNGKKLAITGRVDDISSGVFLDFKTADSHNTNHLIDSFRFIIILVKSCELCIISFDNRFILGLKVRNPTSKLRVLIFHFPNILNNRSYLNVELGWFHIQQPTCIGVAL